MEPSVSAGMSPRSGVPAYFALACGLTWACAAPLSLCWLRHVPPPPFALALAGLSAFGPLLAALVVARRQRALRDVFGRWRANPLWMVLALFTPMALHLVANGLEVALGGTPAQWLYLPATGEHIAALVVFSIGEEFGWRGFAHPRLVAQHGSVKGTLLLGLLWGLWHLGYQVQPDGTVDSLRFALMLVELPLYSLVIAWVFERANRSMAVAIAFHAGGHLDNVQRAPASELRLFVLHLFVVAVAALFAARSLSRARSGGAVES